MRALALLLALAACAPLLDGAPRQLTAAGVRPGVGAAHDFAGATPPLDRHVGYMISTPLRSEPNRMEVVLSRDGDGYRRSETVRIAESSAPEAMIVASMVRQRDGRATAVEGSQVILRATDRLDALGRTLSSDKGGPLVTWEPHDCRAVIGECRTVRTTGGRREVLIVTTSETGGVWREQVRRDPARDPQGRTTLLEESYYSLDGDGMLIDMNRLDHEKDLGAYQEIRRAP